MKKEDKSRVILFWSTHSATINPWASFTMVSKGTYLFNPFFSKNMMQNEKIVEIKIKVCLIAEIWSYLFLNWLWISRSMDMNMKKIPGTSYHSDQHKNITHVPAQNMTQIGK